ncbi:MAG: DUF3365 domain-containing protein [Bryobacteraceae bacterium]
MKLLARFNLIFIVVFGLGLTVAGWLAYGFLQKDAKDSVREQARLMMESTLASREYTASQIEPLLTAHSRHVTVFLPQTVPNYAATQIFDYIHKRNPDYTYKEATLNPTNPVDRAIDWEADVVNIFRNDRSRKYFYGGRPAPGGKSLYFARPIQIADPACLDCHSTPNKAPVSMVRQYGRDNGFGWKPNEIVGAQIVSVPESLPIQIADRAFKTLLAYLCALGLMTLLILDALLIVTVIRPGR